MPTALFREVVDHVTDLQRRVASPWIIFRHTDSSISEARWSNA
ncbi:MAG TPA: hypothetical protein VKV17_17275 [Bryobacteraceae bacterium]|nr:hypothetical protein [Bryobacteraceae bacterium]